MGLKFTSIPNNTWTPSGAAKAKNRREGLRPGFPDMVVLVPPERARDGLGRFLCVEMKRVKGSDVSADQRRWHAHINALRIDGIEAVIAHGAAEAIEYVSGFLKAGDRGSPF